jgi:hypothetical protein
MQGTVPHVEESVVAARPTPRRQPRPVRDPCEELSIRIEERASSARIALVDRRAADSADLLVDALWRHAAALARARLVPAGDPADADVEAELRQLDEEIAALELVLRERPWTEAT